MALNNLAYLYSEKLNNLDRAHELARRSRELLPDDPRIADTLGWILYRRGEYAQALVHLQESAGRLGQLGEVQYHLGMAHYALGNEAPARTAFQLALNLEPQAAWNQEIRDRLMVLDAEVTPASAETLGRLRELVVERKDDVLLLSRLARAMESAGRLDEALATYRRAVTVSPDAVIPLIGQARVTAAQGEVAEALVLARRARDFVKGDPAALYEIGRIGFLAGDHAWSYALLQEAAGGLGNSPQVQFAFAQTALAMGRLEVARGALEKSTGTANAERVALQLGLIPPATGGTLAPLSAETARRLAAAQPGELLADYLKARQQALDGQPADAVKALGRLLETYPHFTPAKRSLATLLAGDAATAGEAEKWARQVREVQANDAEMARVLGVAALARQDHRYAADMLQEAARSLTNDGELFLLLGRARAQNQQAAEARQALNRALALPLTAAQKQQAEALLRQLP
jgi:tetratricopeptide (TPR) repeat protein